MTGGDWRDLMHRMPPGGKLGWLTTDDGVSLRYFTAIPEASRGTLVFLNGRTDFIEKYFETYHDLLEAGWAIAAPEFRGQGLCDRELPDYDKGHVATYDLYVADCRKFMAEVVEPAFHGPMVLLGYSMGGLVAALCLAETGGRAFVATVLVAPLLRPKTDTAPNWLARSTARWMTLSGLGKGYCVGRGAFSFDDAEDVWPALVTSPERFYEVRAHIRAQPDLRLGGPTWSWLDASFRAIDRVMKPGALEEASPNLHFIVAERDQLLFNTAAKDLATRVNAASYSEVPNAQHDMFIERSDLRDRAMAEIMNILAGQAAAP